MGLGNEEIAERLEEIADLLDLEGERFKPEAYRRAARAIEALPERLDAIAARGELRTIPGIGEAIAGKVTELLRTGALAYLERLRSEIPPGVLELMRLPGVGPKTARRFWVELGIEGPRELAEAIAEGRLAGVKGFAERKIAQLASAVAATTAAPPGGRVPLEVAYPLAHALVEGLRAGAPTREIAVAGSFRRGRETVGDLDLLVTSEAPDRVFDAFSKLPEVREVRLRGPTKETVVLASGLQVDLRVVEPASFGAALQYFTGSKDHNVRLRSLARDRGLKINEYGVFRGPTRIGGAREEEVYGALGLPWIPPELREDRGEIALAAAGRLPRLVEASDLVAELHAHLSSTPDEDEVDRLLRDGRARGLRAVGIVVATAREGRSTWTAPSRVLRHLRDAGPPGTRGVPVAELATGPLPPELEPLEIDYVILAPALARPSAAPFGAQDPPVLLVAHAGGRVEELGPVIARARTLGAALEVGPGPDRADSQAARQAREAGVPLAVPTGVGEAPGSPSREVALGYARRAGATKEEVLNARPRGPFARAASRPGTPRARGRRSGRPRS